ncbi:MAG: hypothetical protein OEL76_16470 [Siculibacillus sp.]|nr:hypothetical protein [Siculibacillus sp.]
MPDVATVSVLLHRLAEVARTAGLVVAESAEGDLAGQREAITAKWLLGSRRLTHRISLHPDEAAHVVRFREATTEMCRGLPPPTIGFSAETIIGLRRSGHRTDVSLGGGGAIDFAVAREAIELAAHENGWGFEMELGFPRRIA